VEDVEEIIQVAKKLMLEAGNYGPTVFLKGSEGKVAIGLAEFGETADKRERDMLNAGAFAACKHSVGELELIVFVSEAWMGTNMDIQPSKDPKRIEVLLVNILDTATQEERLVMFEIVRNKQQKVIDLKKPSMPDYDKAESVKGILLPAFQKGYQLIRPVTN